MNTIRLTELDMIIRLGLGFLAGAVIGVERSSRHQVAGLRTHILIATGATLLMLLSIWLPQEFQSMKNGDPGRIAAQVVSGIGFLGAGAIIRLGNNIKGLTTAASLWLVAAVGLAIGAGMFVAAGAALVITLITLIVLAAFEKRFFPTERNKLLEITFLSNNPDTQETLDILRSFGVRVLSMDVDQGMNKGKEKNRGTRLRLFVGISDHIDSTALVKALKINGAVERVEIKEKY
ncbi:MAG: MgtC/SapB family protein [Spirochaetaceae bacterium]|jgi:putative Mg2+ transporter-C (MgtC) family protein|nr:MgtC/SapB family protein [Spirochaetaceae bacterium]